MGLPPSAVIRMPARADVPRTSNKSDGLVVPMPTLPVLPIIVKAEVEVVAAPATVVVAKYKFPPAFLNAHWPTPAPAESESWSAEAEVGLRSHCGVEVPMPTLPLVARKMEEVAVRLEPAAL